MRYCAVDRSSGEGGEMEEERGVMEILIRRTKSRNKRMKRTGKMRDCIEGKDRQARGM